MMPATHAALVARIYGTKAQLATAQSVLTTLAPVHFGGAGVAYNVINGYLLFIMDTIGIPASDSVAFDAGQVMNILNGQMDTTGMCVTVGRLDSAAWT